MTNLFFDYLLYILIWFEIPIPNICYFFHQNKYDIHVVLVLMASTKIDSIKRNEKQLVPIDMSALVPLVLTGMIYIYE